MTIKKGGFARIKTPIVAGKVIRTTYDDDKDEKLHTLRWVDGEGHRQERNLLESELEECEAPANADALDDLPDDLGENDPAFVAAIKATKKGTAK